MRCALSPDPTILAFDTSAAHCAAALLTNGQIVAQRHEPMAKGQAEHLIPLIQDMLDSLGVVPEELDAVGVGTGPGNFTGCRIAVSAARGMALGLGIPSIGVSGFEALLGQQWYHRTEPVLVSLPAQRRGADLILQPFRDGAPEAPPIECTLQDAAQALAALVPASTPYPVLGHGAELLDDVLQQDRGGSAGLTFDGVDGLRIAERIAQVAALKLRDGRLDRPAPLYVRAPDAAPPRDAPPEIVP